MNNGSLIKTTDRNSTPATVSLQPSFGGYSAGGYSAEPQAGSVLDYWRVVCRRKLQIAAFGAAGLAIAAAVTLPQSPAYRATTSLEIQDVKDDVLGKKLFNPSNEAPAADESNGVQTQIKILQSRSLTERALDKVGVHSLNDLSRHSAAPKFLPDFSALAPADNSREALVDKVAKNLKVSSASQTRIVEVVFDAPDPALAANFTNALTAEYIDQNLQARLAMGRKTSEWLVGQLDDLRGKLRQSEDALQSYARANGLVYTGEKQSVSEEKLRQMQLELSKAQSDLVDKQSRYEIARGAKSETVPEVLNDSNLRGIENSLTDLRRQEAELGVTFKPDYAKTRRIHAEIEALETAVAGKREAIVSRLDNELRESERREQMLSNAYARQTRLVANDSEKSIQYDMLKHEVDTNRQVYQAMLQRVKESSIASALKASNVRVIDAAMAPSHPFKPNLPVNTAAGLILGLMIGVAATLVRNKVNASVQEPGDAGLLLGVPELGVIPAAGTSAGLKSGKTLSLLATNNRTASHRLLLSADQSPEIADSFRAVLASILFAGAKYQQRVIAVTSASPAEGKTTTTSNLAAALANIGRKVLLIDGDIRSPKLHDVFGLENTSGLTTLLRRIGSPNLAVESYIKEAAIPNLHVLTSGPGMESGADLLFSSAMPALIAQLRNSYDMILIDTPPMLVMPDARVLGRAADGVVLIARSGQTARSALQAAFRRFVEDQTPVIGIVLNDWDAKNSPYQYYASGYTRETVETAVVKTSPAGA